MLLEYKLYRKEIFNFLATVSIKFEYFAEHTAKMLAKDGIFIQSDKDNPYYLHLAGEYSKHDLPMYVTSVETEQQVLFSKNLKYTNPRTFSLFTIDSNSYKVLCSKYPKQLDLIKGILYPAGTVEEILSKPILSVLSYDASYLYPTERDSLINELNSYVDFLADRWFVRDYDYEELYPFSFWNMMWLLLPSALFTQRIRNLNTMHVHPMHVWEYLMSNGLQDYRKYLTHEQSLFLYRNMAYLRQNKGKANTLEILSDNLLNKLYVTLTGKSIFQETDAKSNICMTTPEFLTEDVLTRYAAEAHDFTAFEDTEIMLRRMKGAELIPEVDTELILKTDDYMGTSKVNFLQTKLLEFKKSIIDGRYTNLLINFMMNTLMYSFAKNKLGFNVKIQDPITNLQLNLNIGEAIALMHYCHHKHLNARNNPITIPTEAVIVMAYKTSPEKPPKYFYDKRKNNNKWIYTDLIDIDEMYTRIQPTEEVFLFKEDFDDHLINQFQALLVDVGHCGKSADLVFNDAILNLYNNYLFEIDTLPINLIPYTSYEDWISSNESLTTIRDTIDQSGNPRFQYDMLFKKVFESIFPTYRDELYRYLVALEDNLEYYNAMTSLFRQMLSYNVDFLETDREQMYYLFNPGLGITTDSVSGSTCIVLPSLTLGYKEQVCEQVTECLDEASLDIEQKEITEYLDNALPSNFTICLKDVEYFVVNMCQPGITVFDLEDSPITIS